MRKVVQDHFIKINEVVYSIQKMQCICLICLVICINILIRNDHTLNDTVKSASYLTAFYSSVAIRLRSRILWGTPNKTLQSDVLRHQIPLGIQPDSAGVLGTPKYHLEIGITHWYVLRSQIIYCFGFSRFITFTTHLDLYYI